MRDGSADQIFVVVYIRSVGLTSTYIGTFYHDARPAIFVVVDELLAKNFTMVGAARHSNGRPRGKDGWETVRLPVSLPLCGRSFSKSPGLGERDDQAGRRATPSDAAEGNE
jgi:hypothetical protein